MPNANSIPFVRPIVSAHLQVPATAERRWHPFITDLFQRVSMRILNDDTFYSDCVGDVRDEFLNQLLTLDNDGYNSTLSVVSGAIGAGKSCFFQYFSRLRKLQPRVHVQDLNIDDPVEKFASSRILAQKIACSIDQRITGKLRPAYANALDTKIRTIAAQHSIKHVDELDKFVSDFKFQGDEFRARYPGMDGQLHLSLVVSALYDVKRKPVWIIIDNVDLLSRHDQQRAINLGHDIFRLVAEQTRQYTNAPRLHIVITCRKDTFTSFKAGAFQGYLPMRFPDPRLLEIARRRLVTAIAFTVRTFSRRKNTFKGLEIHGQKIDNWSAVGSEVQRSILTVINEVERLNDLDQGWHYAIVNGNVRRFVFHWATMMLSSEFVDNVLFAGDEDRESRFLSPFRYQATIIRAGCSCYPGNEKFDAGIDTTEGSLIPNIFDNPAIHGLNNERKKKNYLCLPRIMQYLNLQNDSIPYAKLVGRLSLFFDEDVIVDTVKFLIWSRLIDETNVGARNIATAAHWADITSSVDQFELRKNITTQLFLTRLIPNYEYIRAIAISSLLVTRQVRVVVRRAPSLSEDIDNVLTFFDSLLSIITDNIKWYRTHNVLKDFNETFYLPGEGQRLWTASILACVGSLEEILRVGQARFRPDVVDTLTTAFEKLRVLSQFGRYEIDRVCNA
jgi:hypothetical protein